MARKAGPSRRRAENVSAFLERFDVPDDPAITTQTHPGHTPQSPTNLSPFPPMILSFWLRQPALRHGVPVNKARI
jgi:hypothetical protein